MNIGREESEKYIHLLYAMQKLSLQMKLLGFGNFPDKRTRGFEQRLYFLCVFTPTFLFYFSQR
ncbi:hypothetical protein RchiOBHm_Chr1g0378841 [Rosa chinensis]|uniref:Uncharacterized protein n=1 Tax=Rosa chinensis TaxID=74649 RepID=A0A2P6SNJ8_ROSCH|nr:hypothetical protein RchiOBHm_Chr1g0378841 [Rosa chinensis]